MHQIGIIEADRDRLIWKASEYPGRCRWRKYHDLRLPRHYRIHCQILSLKNQLRQFIIQIQIAGFTAYRPVISFATDKIELGKTGFLFGMGNKIPDLTFIWNVL